VLFLFAMRDSGASPELDRFLAGVEFETVDLSALDGRETGELIRAYLGDPNLEHHLIASIGQLGDGSPLSTL